MNFNELSTYNLADAVKFHNRLNPGLWDANEHLRPEVQAKLLEIAEYFQEFLGLDNLKVKDITISGSNAAYSYTKHSDIDLHLVVDIPPDPVYRELFNAKKYEFNDSHDIRIRGADVELYVQDAAETPVSLGEYSIKNNEWIQVPRRKRAAIDQNLVRHKYEDLRERIKSALAADDADRIGSLIAKIKTMRQAGLDAHGEFGPENLAFKMLRTQGLIEQLYTARANAKDRELSLKELETPRKSVRYGFGESSSPNGVSPETKMFLSEVDSENVVRDFIAQTAKKLDIRKVPRVNLHRDDGWSQENSSFGRYEPDTNELHVCLINRHLLDILRTTAHELAHCRQNELSPLPDNAGETGSKWENQANAMAGVIMRDWADAHPDHFDMSQIEESSGYIPTSAEKNDPRFKTALSVDVHPGQTGKEANKMGLQTDAQGKPALLIKSLKNALREFKDGAKMPQLSQGPGQYRDLNEPLGPETPPTMPAGTVKVDVSDVYDWYKLGQHISNMKGLGKHDFGAGPPSAILSFGDEDTEHKYIKDLEATGLTTTDIDPKDPNQPPGMPRQKTDPTYNVNEAFDQPYPFTWEKTAYGDVDALARLPDGGPLNIMFNKQTNDEGDEAVQVEFYRNNSQEVTSEGDATRIFATVLSAIQQYVKEYKPARLTFSASKETDPTIHYEPGEPQPNPESRAKLYDRLVQRYSKAWGYRAYRADSGNLVTYELARMGNVAVTESFQEELAESLRQEFALLETEYLSEIKMTGKNLRAEAARTGAQAGMEFEMIVPDVGVDEQEPDYEADYDQDTRTRSFEDIRSFFHDGDYNTRRDADNLLEEIQNEFQEWQYEQTAESWARDGLEFITDYISLNDLFDRDEAMAQARDEIMDANPDLPQESEDFQQLISARLDEMEREFAASELESQGRIYDDAFEAFSDEQRDEYDERSFLDDKYPRMTDIENGFDISWPYYTDMNADREGADIDQVADEFSSYMGKPVNASRQYHGGRREAGTYVVEPDGSLQGDNPGDEGLEFVSPPMPIDEMISDLNKVKAWADKTGCYTNESTGLHINISVPNYSLEKLDYVKLALLMGDEYVLELFDRSGNTYAKSAISKIKGMLQKNPDVAPQVMSKMREHMEDLATKAIHTGITDKYTSINTKTGYIEFRSPGGDWLDSNFSKIEDTLMRFTVALSAAIDPAAYRQEYLKKLYKLLEGSQEKGGPDILQLFANYSAGELDKAALIRQVREKQLARNFAKGKTPAGQKYWWNVQWDANRRMEVVAGSKEVARQVAAEEWNVPESQLAIAKVTMLRPYEEPEPKPAAAPGTGNWGIWITNADRFVRSPGQLDHSVLRRFPSREAAEQFLSNTRAERSDMRSDIEVREIPADYQALGAPVGRPVQQRNLVPTGPGPWQIYRRSDNTAVRELEHTNRAGAEAEAITVLGLRGEAPELYGVRTRQTASEPIPGSTIDLQRQRQSSADAAQGGIVDVAPGTAPAPQTLTRPGQPQQTFRGTWQILDPQGNEIHRFSGIGNVQSDANRVAMDWLRQHPGAMQGGVTVAPVMEP